MRDFTYDEKTSVRQQRLQADTGEARANENTGYRAAASCGDRSRYDRSPLANAVSSTC
jgi:hypothetical protein